MKSHRSPQPVRNRKAWAVPILLAAVFSAERAALAQLTFSGTARLAASHSSRVKLAQDDVARAKAVVSENKDMYIPSLNAQGGLGRNYGISLNVPTIVTVTTQSLLFSQTQRDYGRAAKLALEATQRSLADIRMQVEEEAVATWLSLDTAQRRYEALRQEAGIADKLEQVVRQRENAGLESELDAKRAHREAVQARLSALYVADEIGDLREHLAQMLEISASDVTLIPESLPAEARFAAAEANDFDAAGEDRVVAAEANARARMQTAHGDRRSVKLPQFSFLAQYGRISPINDVTDYYDLRGHYDVFSAAVIINFPILDAFRQSKARESMSDATHAQHEVEALRASQREELVHLRHVNTELATRAELAEVDLDIAQDQLKLVERQASSPVGSVNGHPPAPEDTLNAQLDERRRYVDLLDARLQMKKTRITLLRLSGSLEGWLATVDATPAEP